MRRATLARREPLSVGAAAPLFAAAAAAVAVASATAGAARDAFDPWWAEAGALALFLAAGAVTALGAAPLRAPFRWRTHALVLALLLAGTVLEDVAHPDGAAGPPGASSLLVVLLLLLALAAVRPPAEVLAGGALLAVATALAPALLAPWSPLTPARCLAAGAAVLASALGAWAFGRAALLRLASTPPAEDAGDASSGVRLSVRQEAVARLEAEAIPLLTGVLRTGAVDAAGSARAADIADRLRRALVADLARGWLAEAGLDADDRDGCGERMTPQQRTALRAVLAALPLADPARPGRARLAGQDHDAQVVLELPLAAPAGRRAAATLVPLLRAAFVTAELRVEPGRAVVVASWHAQR